MTADGVALGLIVMGLVSSAVVAAAGSEPRLGLRVLLDFLLAAGLIRLPGPQSWSSLGAVVALIVVRQIATRGLSLAPAPRAPPSEVTRSAPVARRIQ